MDNLELMKQEISNLAKEKKEEFEKVSDYIFANPELQKCRRLLKHFLILENQGKQ